MTELVATAVWRMRPEVILALDERLGEPTDSYVNGSQTWIEGHGPNGIALEWRIHPVAGFQRPDGVGTYELWENVVDGLRAGGDPSALNLGAEVRPLDSLWAGLECFAAFGDPIEPAVLAGAATELLGLPPDRAGLVDHRRIADAWEASGGNLSVVDELLAQLQP